MQPYDHEVQEALAKFSKAVDRLRTRPTVQRRELRRWSHGLPGYFCFVLGLLVFVPTAALVGVRTCSSVLVGAAAVHATHGKIGPSFSAIPAPVKSCGTMTVDGTMYTLPCR